MIENVKNFPIFPASCSLNRNIEQPGFSTLSVCRWKMLGSPLFLTQAQLSCRKKKMAVTELKVKYLKTSGLLSFMKDDASDHILFMG